MVLTENQTTNFETAPVKKRVPQPIRQVRPSAIDDASPASTPVHWRTVDIEALKNAVGRSAEEVALEQARREGIEEGLRAGRADAHMRLPSIQENISATLAQLAEFREQLRDELAEELVCLAVTVAARVIHREAVIDSTAMAGLIKAAYQKLQSREISRVRLHPALEQIVSSTLQQCGSPATLVLIPDPSLKAGELLFETSQGVLDASLDTQLRELERGLLDKLGNRS